MSLMNILLIGVGLVLNIYNSCILNFPKIIREGYNE